MSLNVCHGEFCLFWIAVWPFFFFFFFLFLFFFVCFFFGMKLFFWLSACSVLPIFFLDFIAVALSASFFSFGVLDRRC